MATLKTSGTQTTSDNTSLSTAAVTPDGDVTLLGIMVGATSIATPTPTGARETWTLVDSIAGAFFTTYLYVGTGAPTTEVITVTRQGTDTWNGSAWVVAEESGINSTAIQTAKTYEATSDTATASFGVAFEATSSALSIYSTQNGTGASAQSGWTQLANPTIGGVLSFAMAFLDDDTVTDAVGTFSPTGTGTTVLGVEFGIAAAPTTPAGKPGNFAQGKPFIVNQSPLNGKLMRITNG